MKAAPFAYARATSLAELFDIWEGAGEDAALVAGGQSLLAALAFRLSQPSALIDIGRIPDLKGIRETDEAIRVGALTTHDELGRDPLVRDHVPLLAEAVPLIAHPAIRNRGTIGGSLAYADPAAELPACAVALDATVHVIGRAGARAVPARDFFQGLFATALGERELIAAVSFPKAPGRRAAIDEIARRSGDYAIAGLAASLALEAGTVRAPRLVFFGVGEGPVPATAAERALEGSRAEPAALAAAQAALAEDLAPPSDLHGGPELRLHLCRVLLARVVGRLAGITERSAA